jgi:hypothetical protein
MILKWATNTERKTKISTALLQKPEKSKIKSRYYEATYGRQSVGIYQLVNPKIVFANSPT